VYITERLKSVSVKCVYITEWLKSIEISPYGRLRYPICCDYRQILQAQICSIMTVAHVISTFNWLYPLITGGDVEDGITPAEMTSLVALTRAVDTTRYLVDADLVWHDTRGQIGNRLSALLRAMQERGIQVICVKNIHHAEVRDWFSQHIAVESEEEKHRTVIQLVNEFHPSNVVFFVVQNCPTGCSMTVLSFLQTLFGLLRWRMSRKTISRPLQRSLKGCSALP
jgi:hypothetical protein